MTSGAFDEFEDPEEAAGDSAERAWMRVAARRGAALSLTVFSALALVLCDYAFAVISFWFLPAPIAGAVALAMGAELGAGVAGYRHGRRAAKAAAPAHVSDGEKWQATVAWYQKPAPPSWWQARPDSLMFWRGLAQRAMYSSCFGAVIGVWAGSAAAGIIAGVTYTAWCTALGWWLPRARLSFGRVLAFSDPSAPRDTPEM